MDNKLEITEEMFNRRCRQFLVHSFLYYELNESIIDDFMYDKFCKELYILKTDGSFENHMYYSYVKDLDMSGSGFYISKYPIEIISKALHLLHYEKNRSEEFGKFVERYGYKLK